MTNEPQEAAELGATQRPAVAQATSASEWRRDNKEGVVITLPSGKSARIKRSLDLMTLIRSGRIPNPLRGIIEESIATQSNKMAEAGAMDGEMLKQLMKLLDATAVKSFVEPRVVAHPDPPEPPSEEADKTEWDSYWAGMAEWEQWEPPAGVISTGDLDMDDKMYVFMFAQGMAGQLETFREVKAAGMAAVQNVGAV